MNFILARCYESFLIAKKSVKSFSHAMRYKYKLLAVSYGTGSISLSSRVQEIWSHKITNAYRTIKHGILQGLTAPIAMGMSLCLNTSL